MPARKKAARSSARKEEAATVRREEAQLSARIPKNKMRAFRLKCFQQGVTVKATIERLVDGFLAR